MSFLLFQIILPFILSAMIVIIIMFIAERYGTKIGGILGTLPSTIVIAFAIAPRFPFFKSTSKSNIE